MIEKYQRQINEFLNKHLTADSDEPHLATSMNYSVTAGGKRLRPALTLAVADALEVSLNATVLQAACAVELLHTYSLIHDDLPAMDNDDLRRGLPTNHRRFGAGMATLAGDGLLTLAFQWLSTSGLATTISLRLVQELARAAGPQGMVAGQAMDIANTGHHLNYQQLQRLHRGKTGALLRYSVLAGGIIAQADDDCLKLLADFGSSYGLAFQIYDDLMDEISSPEKMGKEVHKDQNEAKNTYPGLFGVDGTKHHLDQVVNQAKDIADRLQRLNPGFKVLNEFLVYYHY